MDGSRPLIQRQMSHGITYIWNLKKMIQMNLYTEIDPQTESNLMVTKVEREEGEIRSLGLTDTHYYI